MFGKIALFELRYQLRNPVFWVAAVIFFLLTYGAMASDDITIGGGGNVNLNSPVAIVTTRLAPTVLLSYLHTIEDRHGRVRRERWGDRTLDLDLIAYGDVVCDTPTLTLPHPRAAERDFVLAPWLSIDPDASLVGAGRVADLLERLGASS